jgi:signal transduction histidine kinase
MVWEAVGTPVALAIAASLLARTAGIALRPLDQVVETARRMGAGGSGERLNPSRTNTELGRLALAFDEMLDALETALGEARASEDRSRRFLAEAAHQLRTPIAGIRSSVESLPYARTDSERERLLDNAAQEAGRAGRRVSALLRMARLEQGDLPARRACDLASVCRDETERAAALSPNLHVSFRALDEASTVELDPDAIREALANVIDNARRHAVERIEVTLATTGDSVEVAIADDGPGLPRGGVDQAFEPFVALDTMGGSGLGLAIARGIARAHDGEVAYEQGRFVIRLPQARQRPVPSSRSSTSAPVRPRVHAP